MAARSFVALLQPYRINYLKFIHTQRMVLAKSLPQSYQYILYWLSKMRLFERNCLRQLIICFVDGLAHRSLLFPNGFCRSIAVNSILFC